MELYKYCESSHMEAMLRKGCTRIGTLHDFRNHDQHGEWVRDNLEGYTRTETNVIFYDHRFLDTMKHVGTGSSEGTGANWRSTFSNDAFYSEDIYLYSASLTYSETDHRRWHEMEGYDACYKINSARLFFRALSEARDLQAKASFVCSGSIHYYDENKPNNIFFGTFHPALVKRRNFEVQSEYRALWAAPEINKGISPFIIAESNAKLYCEPRQTI